MKLFDSVGPNPRVVRIAMAEQGVSPEVVTVDIIKGENRQPAYLALVPSGGTPALVGLPKVARPEPALTSKASA